MPRINPHARFEGVKIGPCYLRLSLDTRHEVNKGKYRVCISIRWAGSKRCHYYGLMYEMSKNEFKTIAGAIGKSTVNYELRTKLIDDFNAVVEKVSDFSHDKAFCLKLVIEKLNGTENSVNLISFWKTFAAKKAINTKESYINALKSFCIVTKNVIGFNVSKSDIELWTKKMAESGYSQTTIGIYLRACRAVMNAAIAEGHMPASSYPFGKSAGKVSIPSGKNRKKEYLTTEQMAMLYDIFAIGKYPTGKKINRFARKMLGMFLIQYLANGINMADLARLVYSEYYYSSGEKALEFTRKKVESRTAQEVIIPITSELKVILDSIAFKPECGALLFPWISGESDIEEFVIKRIALYNSYIRRVMADITETLGWPEKISSTWARHSFATNLAHQGVPQQYISEAMGHSTASGSVTQRYIDAFPLEKQMEFNSLLLGGKRREKTVTISQKEYEELLKMKNRK